MKAALDPIAVLDAFDTVTLRAVDPLVRAQLAQQVLPSKEVRDAAQTCEQEAAKFLTDLLLDRPVYNALAAVDVTRLDPVAQYILRADLREYHRRGLDKDDATQAKIRKINEELEKISQEFERNIADDVRKIEFNPADLDGLPEDFTGSHPPGPNGKVTLTTNNTEYRPVMRYANSPKAREAFYRLYNQKAYPKNMDVLARMLQKRYELAKLLGYQDWADFMLENKMAGSKQNAEEFIEKVHKAADSHSRLEYEELLAAKKRIDPSAATLDAWDVWVGGGWGTGGYLRNRVLSEKYAFDTKVTLPYFEYSRVKQGLLDLTSKMYGISYRRVSDAAVWHKDVEVYDVYDGGRLLSRIYFDLFPRDNKYKHYATFSLALGKKGVELPEGVLVCNFPRPGKEPALMEYTDVVIFFHEYGHLLEAIFSGQNQWLGPEPQWDFGEVASQILEEWARDPRVLQSFAKHYQTNAPIPADMVQKLQHANQFGQSMAALHNTMLSAVSLHYHARNPEALDSTSLMADAWNKYLPYKYVDGTYFQTQWDHLDGYSACFYTYLWSLVISKDAFSVFRENGLLNPDVSGRFRRSVLEWRGTKPAAEQIREFLGRPYSFRAYEDWLNSN
jgi:thimet oligopeptidase